MSKTFKDDQKIHHNDGRKKKNDYQIHKEYINRKKEKRIENALRSCDIDTLSDEDFQII